MDFGVSLTMQFSAPLNLEGEVLLAETISEEIGVSSSAIMNFKMDMFPSGATPSSMSSSSCDDLGWTNALTFGSTSVCGESALNLGGCSVESTWADAKEWCESSGARLCNIDELIAQETRGTGCRLDNKLVWSSSSCDGGYWVATGKGANLGCASESSFNKARCCADVMTVTMASAALSFDVRIVSESTSEMISAREVIQEAIVTGLARDEFEISVASALEMSIVVVDDTSIVVTAVTRHPSPSTPPQTCFNFFSSWVYDDVTNIIFVSPPALSVAGSRPYAQAQLRRPKHQFLLLLPHQIEQQQLLFPSRPRLQLCRHPRRQRTAGPGLCQAVMIWAGRTRASWEVLWYVGSLT